MRLWHIPVGYLDRQRLQSQHYEAHGLLTCCLEGRRWGAISAQFEKSCHYITLIHDRCAIEMGIRKGMTESILRSHSSPIEIPEGTDPEKTSIDYRPTLEEYKTDIIHLRNKWEREGYFFGIGRIDLSFLEKRVDLPVLRPVEECLELQKKTKMLRKEHQDFLKSIKGDKRLGDKLDELFEHLGQDLLERRSHVTE